MRNLDYLAFQKMFKHNIMLLEKLNKRQKSTYDICMYLNSLKQFNFISMEYKKFVKHYAVRFL